MYVRVCCESAGAATVLAKATLSDPTVPQAPTAAAIGVALREDDTLAVRDVNSGSARAEGPFNSVSVTIAAGHTGLTKTGHASSSSGGSSSSEQTSRPPACLVPVHEDPATTLASTNSLCPVVAFTSFAGQLGFKAMLHIAVFSGEGGSSAVVHNMGTTQHVVCIDVHCSALWGICYSLQPEAAAGTYFLLDCL